jgi:hypothetical protein
MRPRDGPVPDGEDLVAAVIRMRLFARCLMLLFALATAARAAPPDPPSLTGYKAVLIAGDSSAKAFDHATDAMRDRLLASRVAPADIQRLSATRAAIGRDGVRPSTLNQVLMAIASMHPGAGQGCFVFATSHGAFGEGLVLMPSRNFLTPFALDNALNAGCGDAPTVVIISGCFSGNFVKPPMARANRIVLTAAREDRSSFGCGAEFRYTFYDRCLLSAMDHSATWQAAYGSIRECVATREAALRFVPSEPRAWFGQAVAEMPILQGR